MHPDYPTYSQLSEYDYDHGHRDGYREGFTNGYRQAQADGRGEWQVTVGTTEVCTGNAIYCLRVLRKLHREGCKNIAMQPNLAA